MAKAVALAMAPAAIAAASLDAVSLPQRYKEAMPTAQATRLSGQSGWSASGALLRGHVSAARNAARPHRIRACQHGDRLGSVWRAYPLQWLPPEIGSRPGQFRRYCIVQRSLHNIGRGQHEPKGSPVTDPVEQPQYGRKHRPALETHSDMPCGLGINRSFTTTEDAGL